VCCVLRCRSETSHRGFVRGLLISKKGNPIELIRSAQSGTGGVPSGAHSAFLFSAMPCLKAEDQKPTTFSRPEIVTETFSINSALTLPFTFIFPRCSAYSYRRWARQINLLSMYANVLLEHGSGGCIPLIRCSLSFTANHHFDETTAII